MEKVMQITQAANGFDVLMFDRDAEGNLHRTDHQVHKNRSSLPTIIEGNGDDIDPYFEDV